MKDRWSKKSLISAWGVVVVAVAGLFGGAALADRASAQDGGNATPHPSQAAPVTSTGGATQRGEGASIPVVVPGRPRAFVSIQYPGLAHGRFNEFSEGVAPEIVELAHAMGFSGVGHWQPEGYAKLSAIQLASRYTAAADQYMVPTSLVLDFSPNFLDAWELADALGMDNLYYDGTACVVNVGTPDAPDVRYVSLPDDAALITERVRRICERLGPDYLFIDNISLLGSMFGKATAQSNAGRTTQLIRADSAAPPAKSEKTIGLFVRAVMAGAPPETVIGFEPIPDAAWKTEQMDAGYGSKAPLMQMVELEASGPGGRVPALRDFPEATRDHSFVVMNDHTAGYTLADITRYVEIANDKGYTPVITWWVLKKAIEQAGRFDLIPPPPSKPAGFRIDDAPVRQAA